VKKVLPLFWDSSALVSLLLKEKRSALVINLWEHHTEMYGWEWILLEVDAALIRRKAVPETFKFWRELQRSLRLLSFASADLRELRRMNMDVGLRAADAGHLFVFEQLSHRIPNLALVSFDREMVEAAYRLGLFVHSDCS